MKLIFLDVKTLGFPVDVSILDRFGQVSVYDDVPDSEVGRVIHDAEILITNQNRLNERNLKSAEKLKLICQTGTGYNNIDVEYCRRKGIAVTNVPGYAASSVAQHTFAMLFYLISHSAYYDRYTKYEYSKGVRTLHQNKEFFELEGKTWGIIGMGQIGRKVAQYAGGFGCNIVYYSTSGQNRQSSFQRVTLEEVLSRSDILSIHAPLNESTRNLIGRQELRSMKPTAYLLNLGRGGIVRESDLANALKEKWIAGAGLDVFEQEPLPPDHPLIQLSDCENLYMTPHIGYASIESRMRLMESIGGNIECFLKGEPQNRIV